MRVPPCPGSDSTGTSKHKNTLCRNALTHLTHHVEQKQQLCPDVQYRQIRLVEAQVQELEEAMMVWMLCAELEPMLEDGAQMSREAFDVCFSLL